MTDKRESRSRPAQGIAEFEHVARNQHGDVVAKVVRRTLMWLSPGARG